MRSVLQLSRNDSDDDDGVDVENNNTCSGRSIHMKHHFDEVTQLERICDFITS